MLRNLCKGCGRLIENNFIFCPWCGIQLMNNNSKEYIENLSTKIEFERKQEQQKKIENVGKQIDNLEKELEIIVLSTKLAE